jgi:YVTN family beta-propeller protein
VTSAFDDIWVSSYFDGTITRIDPANGKVLAEITTEQGPQIMAEAGGLLWVSCTDTDTVNAIDPATDEVVATVDTAVTPDGLAFDGTTLWVATEIGPELTGIDPSTQEVVARATVADHGLINANQVMVFEDGSLWLPILEDGAVLRVAPPAT